MAVKCLNCGYEMKTNQEVHSASKGAGIQLNAPCVQPVTLLNIIMNKLGIPIPVSGVPIIFATAVHFNNSDHAVPCPKCGQKPRWEDFKSKKESTDT